MSYSGWHNKSNFNFKYELLSVYCVGNTEWVMSDID